MGVRDRRWAVYDESMSRKDLIPASPAEAEYLKTVEGPPIAETADPFVLFADWLSEAKVKEPNDANAMALATVDADRLPDVRMVLLKDFDERGFVFYSNLESAKGLELAGTPRAGVSHCLLASSGTLLSVNGTNGTACGQGVAPFVSGGGGVNAPGSRSAGRRGVSARRPGPRWARPGPAAASPRPPAC